jgi:hypothetical protein
MQFLFSITWGSVSGWWALACLALGILYAWLLYKQPVNLARQFRWLLSVFRTLVVFFVAFLLLSPLVRSVSYNPQRPLILILQDNSQSVKLFHAPGENVDSVVNNLSSLKQKLGNDYDIRVFHFDRYVADGLINSFNGKQTDISNALKQLDDRFVNQNVGALVLATDGLYNQGADPQYEAKNIKSPIYTIALGDTIARRDLLIGNVNYNKTAFLGNDFEIDVLAEAYQAKGEIMHLTVTEDGRRVAEQNISVASNDFHQVETLKLNADKKGTRKFNINIAPVSNEISTDNNSQTIYVDVLDAKQKILLVYNGPHPDISVIRQAIESNKNYEVKATLLSALTAVKPSDYSLLILYQVPTVGNNILEGLIKTKIPVWYILGAQSNLPAFDQDQKLLQVSTGQDQMQEVFAQPVTDFTGFTLSDSARKKIAAFPPLLAPYGSYSSAPAGSLLLKQRIGNVQTAYPLLAFGDQGGERIGVLTGEGIWRWQLAEYEACGNHHSIEELFSQAVQYLTSSANRQRFIVYPSKRVFDEGENVLLNAELYNDALELVNTPDVKIDLQSDKGKHYSFLFTRNNQSYQLDAGALPVGEYSYTASAKNGPKTFTATGELAVKPLNLEMGQSAANFQLLNNIAKQSGGKMLRPNQVDQLPDLIRKNENIKTVVYEDKRYSDLADVKWVFILILALLSAEWFVRKREGEV